MARTTSQLSCTSYQRYARFVSIKQNAHRFPCAPAQELLTRTRTYYKCIHRKSLISKKRAPTRLEKMYDVFPNFLIHQAPPRSLSGTLLDGIWNRKYKNPMAGVHGRLGSNRPCFLMRDDRRFGRNSFDLVTVLHRIVLLC